MTFQGITDDFAAHANTYSNILRGVLERVFYVKTAGGFKRPPTPTKGAFERLKTFRTKVTSRMPLVPMFTTEEFLDCYSGRRRRRYEMAAESLEALPLQRSDAGVSTFVKCEKTNFTTKQDPAPRVIQPRSARYNLSVGRYLKPLEHGLFRAIDGVFKHPTVAKGKNALERGQMVVDAWGSFRDPVAIGLDASRFDQHCSRRSLRYEHGFYLKLFQNDSELGQLLGLQLVNRGYGRSADGVVKYSVSGCRMSGDMNTSMGNVILMCAMMWQFFRDHHIKARLVNDGDDCVVIAERSDATVLENTAVEWFREFGFTMKIESRAEVLEEIDFCQSRPVYSSRGWVMCRDPRVVLTKDLHVSRRLMTRQQVGEHASAVGQCGLALAGDIPILGEFYRTLSLTCKSANLAVEGTGMERLASGLHPCYRIPTTLTRVSFWRAFGIPPEVQEVLEENYRSRTPTVSVPRLGHIINTDDTSALLEQYK